MKKNFVNLLLLLAFFSCKEEIDTPTLSQISISNITNCTADVSCAVTNDGNSPVDTIGIYWYTTEMATFDNSTYKLSCSSSLDYRITDLVPKTKYYIQAFAANEKGLSYSIETSFTTEPNETDVFIDVRDGQEYKIVKIGEQWWFAENLNYKTDVDSWYFNDDSINNSPHGRLYTLESALKAIPDGWRLSTENDWEKIERELGMSIDEINENGWRGFGLAKYLWDDAEFDFDVKWNGIRDTSNSVLYDDGASAYFWTSTIYNETPINDTYYCRHLNETFGSIRRRIEAKWKGLSVRCVKN